MKISGHVVLECHVYHFLSASYFVLCTAGMAVLASTYLGAGLLHYTGRMDLTIFYDHFLSFMTAAIVFSVYLSFYLFISSF